jgi:hypothetical protein
MWLVLPNSLPMSLIVMKSLLLIGFPFFGNAELGGDSGDVFPCKDSPIPEPQRWFGHLSTGQQVDDSMRFAAEQAGHVAKQAESVVGHDCIYAGGFIFLMRKRKNMARTGRSADGPSESVRPLPRNQSVPAEAAARRTFQALAIALGKGIRGPLVTAHTRAVDCG